ncbi:MAG: hypothetical protein KDA05_07725 [Phycisphaerales bacterium]|nr:hypothetical protein [Phycisphaerales bacterium]MCB9841174.1 hypothetical protein [Phycisphaeraceae bacterium]
MAAFVIYGVLVWWLAFAWRGSWRAWAAPIAGLLGIVLVAWLHVKLSEWTNGRIYLRALQVLLYPYGVLVTAVGLFIAAIPATPVGRRDGLCHACRYDLRGRTERDAVCPECGARVLEPGERGTRRREADRSA